MTMVPLGDPPSCGHDCLCDACLRKAGFIGRHSFTPFPGPWTCPRCNSVYGPAAMECIRCNPPQEIAIT